MIFGVKMIYWNLCDGALLNINQLVLANWLFYNVGAVTYMDARTNLIIANGKTITPNVSECVFDNVSNKWVIKFDNGKVYKYNRQNVIYLDKPAFINPQNCQIWHRKQLLYNVVAIYDFKGENIEYWHIVFANGSAQDYKFEELKVKKSVLENGDAKQIFDYFREVADFISVRTDDDTAILSQQYKKIDYLSEDTASALYLKPDTYCAHTDCDFSAPIFPFGCNDSQFNAVTNALANRISVIEGPPGTGKTQTILNIIANLVIQGKTIQVVSNNNSAIDNVFDKLAYPQYQMDFIVAKLGNNNRKESFIKSQNGKYPNFADWLNDTHELKSGDINKMVREKSIQLQKVFQDQKHLADLQQEKYDVELEYNHISSLVINNTLVLSKRKLSSGKLMDFWQEYQDILNGTKKACLLYKLYRCITHGISVGKLMNEDSVEVINRLQCSFYEARLNEIENEISETQSRLDNIDSVSLIKEFTEISLCCFKEALVKRYVNTSDRPVFTKEDFWKNPNTFLDEYPVVLSTTYTSRSSLCAGIQYDYVIIDEASQSDVATGMLALSCASNAVVVGDIKQLPNVVTGKQQQCLYEMFSKYNINEGYNFAKHSFLSSVHHIFWKKIPKVTLCEHYRCHPQIIGFCNKKFYNDELIIMTKGDTDGSALQLVTTVPGSHERDHMNQRQIDVICRDILPQLDCSNDEVGVITPYRNQVEQLSKELYNTGIDIATVHKFQGREKEVIILSTVDDTVTSFSDDPNLLNVAISRAKKRLILVTSNKEQPLGSNIGDLIGYIRYNNCDIQHSEISSVFDYLYRQYNDKRLEYLKGHKRISEYDSENLMFALIQEVLSARDYNLLGVLCHHPLQLLFVDKSKMTVEEQRFVNTGLSHIDFLIFNKVTKMPILAIEVDGFYYHRDGTRQAERDALKDHILEVYGLPLLRFKTNGSGEREMLSQKLDELYRMGKDGIPQC